MEKKQSKRLELSPEGQAVITNIARALALTPAPALVVTLLGMVEKAMYCETEAKEAITEEEQIAVAKLAVTLVREAMDDMNEAQGGTHPTAKQAGLMATDALKRTAAKARAEKGAAVDFKIPPGGIIAPGSDTVN